jgi:putative tricarboxylic transport membrane protein
MLLSQGSMKIFWSNWLVGSITALAMLMLFWPLLARLLGIVRRGRKTDPIAAQ